MRIEPLGDASFVVSDLPVEAYRFADAVVAARLHGLRDAAPSYDRVGVYFEPDQWDAKSLRDALSGLEFAPAGPVRLHEIPVCYDMGEDLGDVASCLRLSRADVIAIHSGQLFECFALGFCPGFPYLGWLPPPLCGVGRLDSPRTRVPAGSVGIAGRQTGIYPVESPGGWSLIGRTPLKIADASTRRFPISAGDRVRFVPIDEAEFARREDSSL